ncbi:DMT family transporter [Rhizobium sp. CSW-27]|uniref:DMT family transporter n=1 Tax=Rhizobium sp. CSW-27 TaxID=2839985 RepID=UPI001C039A04|nr:DMT family transporter [Rhizobium sp. CSW-27]MBT9372440.1 DMT family transporter [Rhizobium sp. CSW-27]
MPLSQNARGAVMMTLAMGVFTTNDAFVKLVTPEMNVGQIMFIRGMMTTAMLLLLARHLGVLAEIRQMLHPKVILRSAFEIGAAITYISALAHIDLAVAATILLSLPLAVTFGAWLFFKEPVGWRRWSAILVGFAGVLVVLRPSPEDFVPASLLAVVAVFFTAGRDLTTRRLPAALPTLLVSLFAALTNTLFGAALIVPFGGWSPVSGAALMHLAVAAVLLLAGYQTIVIAMRSGEISVVAPFRYTSLIFSLSLGFYFFGERPDAYMAIGASLIVASGLYAFYREKRRASPLASATEPRMPH